MIQLNWQFSLLRLQVFIYDEIDRLVVGSEYMLLETDTDNFFLVLSKPTLDKVLKPHLKDKYIKTKEGQCKDGSTPLLWYLLSGPVIRNYNISSRIIKGL